MDDLQPQLRDDLLAVFLLYDSAEKSRPEPSLRQSGLARYR
jgi:hypothetical protein